MALGADDVQAAELDHPLVLRIGDLLAPRPGRLARLGGRGGGVEPLLAQQGLGQEVRVAAEQDVGAAAGHVGGDRDRLLAPGLGHDLGLALVVLGVQHLVRMPRFLRSLERRSDFSMETVPTSTGWPLPCRSAISLATASNFSRSVL